MRRIGMELISQKKTEILSEKEGSSSGKGRDLLSLLIKANMKVDVSETQRMSDEEVYARKSLDLACLGL